MLILSDRATKKMLLDLKSIEPLLNLMEENSFAYELTNFQSIEFFIGGKKNDILFGGRSLSIADGVYIKRVGKFLIVSTLVARFLEKRKIPFVDSYHTYGSINGKLAQMFVLSENGLPIPKTYYATTYSREKLLKAATFLNYPIVAKKIFSRRGEGVFLVKTERALMDLMNRRDQDGIILQEYIPNKSDYRIFVTGKIVGAFEERIRQNKKEFRNNASLGGKELYSDPKKTPAPLRKMAIEAAKILHIEIAGVDIVISSRNKKKYLFEVNRSPGFTPADPKSTEVTSLFKYLCKIRKSSSTLHRKK